MSALWLALAFVPGPDLEAPVTFSHRAAPVAVVLEALSKATKQTFLAAPAMAADVVVVNVEGVSLRKVLDKIAAVTGSEWRTEGDGMRLQPNPLTRQQESVASQTMKLQHVRKMIADRLEKQRNAAANEAKRKALEARALKNPESVKPEEWTAFMDVPSQASRFFNEILPGLDQRALANLDSNGRLVFASQPTRMQRPLPNAANAALARYVQAWNAEHKGSGGVESVPTDPDEPEMPEVFTRMAQRNSQVITGVAKTLVIISRREYGSFGSTQIQLRFFDAKGKAIHDQTEMLEMDSEMFAAMRGAEPAAPGEASTPVTLSPLTESLMKAMTSGVRGGTMDLPANLREALFRPDLHDPQSFLATDALISLAKARRKPLVACVPDDAFAMSLGQPTTLTVQGVEKELKKGTVMRTTEDPEFLLAIPADPFEARRNRLNRASLAKFLQRASGKGLPSLDALAEYAVANEDPMQNPLATIYFFVAAPGTLIQGVGGITNWSVLRVYASLSPTQRLGVRRGMRIPFSQLNPAQVRETEKYLFGNGTNLAVASEVKEAPSFLEMAMSMATTGENAQTEPTEAMPNGLPANGLLEFSATSEPVAVPEGGQTSLGLGVLGADEIALFKMISDMPNMGAVGAMMPKLDKLRIGERTVIRMLFRVNPQVSAQATLHDNRMPDNATIASMSNLPAAFQERIKQRTEALKKSPFGDIGRFMPGVQAPPPAR